MIEEAIAAQPSFTESLSVEFSADDYKAIPANEAANGKVIEYHPAWCNGVTIRAKNYSHFDDYSRELIKSSTDALYNTVVDSKEYSYKRQMFSTFPSYDRTCAVYNNKIFDLFPKDRGLQIHDANFTLVLVERELEAIGAERTWIVTAPTEIPFYSAEFTYKMNSRVPGLNFSGNGTGFIKVYKAPDKGRWTLQEFTINDPQIVAN